VSDTVGFIRKLPHELEAAFRATLEELYDAALLVHVVDASDRDVLGKYHAVRRILDDMELTHTPELVAINKVDATDEAHVTPLVNELGGVPISASKKIGLGVLLSRIDGLVPKSAASSPPDAPSQF
jgi:GTP-binding protein HflX